MADRLPEDMLVHTIPIRRHVRRLLTEIAPTLPARSLVLDVGAGEYPPFRDALPATWRYVDVDLESGDVWIGGAETLPFRDGAFDVVVSYAVLEHLPEPEAAIREARRVLRLGGRLLLGAPGVYPYHPFPADFTRWTAEGMTNIIGHAFEVESVRPLGGVVLTFTTLVGFYIEAMARRRRGFRPLLVLVRLLNAVGYALDKLVPTMSDGRERYGGMSVGYLVVARAA